MRRINRTHTEPVEQRNVCAKNRNIKKYFYTYFLELFGHVIVHTLRMSKCTLRQCHIQVILYLLVLNEKFFKYYNLERQTRILMLNVKINLNSKVIGMILIVNY